MSYFLLQSEEACILWSHHEETRELPGERNNARNNARCTHARKTTHGLDRQHQVVDRTLCGRVNQNDRGYIASFKEFSLGGTRLKILTQKSKVQYTPANFSSYWSYCRAQISVQMLQQPWLLKTAG